MELTVKLRNKSICMCLNINVLWLSFSLSVSWADTGDAVQNVIIGGQSLDSAQYTEKDLYCHILHLMVNSISI